MRDFERRFDKADCELGGKIEVGRGEDQITDVLQQNDGCSAQAVPFIR